MSLSSRIYLNRSVIALILANLVTIVFAVVEKWDLSYVMLIYWAQSVIIGLFNWKRILDLKQFSTKGFQINDRPVKPTRATQLQTAFFFLLHYGFFHFIYLIFLASEKRTLSAVPVLGLVVCVATFIVNHFFSYLHNRKTDATRKPNIGTIMFFPYARIIPMHLTLLSGQYFAAGSRGALVLFLALKTLADVIMHTVKHAIAGSR